MIPQWSKRSQDSPGHQQITETESKTLDAKGGLTNFFHTLEAEIQASKTTAIQKANSGNIDLIKHLKAVCTYRSQYHLVLIIVDEVQKIKQLAESNPEHNAALHSNLYILNDDSVSFGV